MDQEMGMMSGWTRSQLNIAFSSAQPSLGKASHSSVSILGFFCLLLCKGRNICNTLNGSDEVGNHCFMSIKVPKICLVFKLVD